jgi:hypothetical protein
MPFFNVDDQLHGHPKARAAGLAAIGLWTLAGSHCRAYKSDGNVPAWFVAGQPQGARLAARLVAANMWHAPGHDCDECPEPAEPDGWIFHDWLDVNTSAEEVERQREQNRKRQRRRRAKLYALRDETEAGHA